MSDKLTGKIVIIAKTGGIKIEGNDSWFNPTDKVKEHIGKFVKGDTVELTVQDGKITFIKNVESGPSLDNPVKASYDDTQRLIVRQSCLKAAIELLTGSHPDDNKPVTKDTILNIAEVFVDWVYEKQSEEDLKVTEIKEERIGGN